MINSNKNSNKSLLKIYVPIACTVLIMLVLVFYSFVTGSTIAAKHAPLVGACMEIKLEATTAHLWFEELITGDRYLDIDIIWHHLDEANWYANAMLEGGNKPEGTFVPLSNEKLRNDIRQVQAELTTFRKTAEQRWSRKLNGKAGVGSDIDQQFDATFARFIKQADRVEAGLHQLITRELGIFKKTQYFLFATIIGLSLTLLFVFLRYEHKSMNDLQSITDAKDKAEGAIHKLTLTQKRVSEVLDGADALIYVSDMQTGEILFINKYGKSHWGAIEGEICWKVIQKKTDGPCEFCTNRKLVDADGNPTEGVIWELKSPVNDRWYHCCDKAIRWLDGRTVRMEIASDITALKRADEERQNLEAAIRKTQKLESLGVLAGGIAHDFNNLLMAILGNADLAQMELSPLSPAHDRIEDIITSARRAADLCKQMLAYSGRGKFVIEALSLTEIVEEMFHMLEVSISKKAVLKYNFAANIPAVRADATQIRQIILNLITNASEAIGDRSGVISINTGAMDCDRNYLSESYLDENLPEGLYSFFEVADTGCGMTDETKEKLFDPFYTTKFTGRGLGLSAVLGIVRGHNGAIKIYSELNKGTAIKVLFPAVDEPTQKIKPSDQCEEDTWRGSGTILLVDDEESILAVGKRYLEKKGFNVLIAQDGRVGLELFRKHAEEIVCVILDLTMPHLDGEETFREMRRIKRGVRVIMSSGYNEQDIFQRLPGKGLAGFIQKPYQSRDLWIKLREVLGDGTTCVARTDQESS